MTDLLPPLSSLATYKRILGHLDRLALLLGRRVHYALSVGRLALALALHLLLLTLRRRSDCSTDYVQDAIYAGLPGFQTGLECLPLFRAEGAGRSSDDGGGVGRLVQASHEEADADR